MGIKLKAGTRSTVVPDGEYLAKVIDIRAGEAFKKPILEFDFEIADGDHRGTLLRGFANFQYEAFSAHTKLSQWLSRITRFEPGEEIDTDVFLDKLLKVRVETKESRRTKNKFSNVTDILSHVADL